MRISSRLSQITLVFLSIIPFIFSACEKPGEEGYVGPNRLYLNQGDLKFSELTDAGGAAGAMSWSTGATILDVNADGRMDIYVCNSGDPSGGKRSNELFINTGATLTWPRMPSTLTACAAPSGMKTAETNCSATTVATLPTYPKAPEFTAPALASDWEVGWET